MKLKMAETESTNGQNNGRGAHASRPPPADRRPAVRRRPADRGAPRLGPPAAPEIGRFPALPVPSGLGRPAVSAQSVTGVGVWWLRPKFCGQVLRCANAKTVTTSFVRLLSPGRSPVRGWGGPLNL
jgi:hypothetical protein